VLLALKLMDRLTVLAAPANDLVAAMIEIEHLPTRVRLYSVEKRGTKPAVR
jgi:hypothetical protein